MLSKRQVECLFWAREGKSSTDIGAILGISPRTVDDHLAAACSKLGVRTRTQAVAEAIALGFLGW
jgi:DNA-binding CsgD family transcriptional regulator